MRENDDVTPGTSGGSLGEGLGETAEPGGGSSSGPFGHGDVDDSYGDSTGSQVDDTDGDDTDGDDTYGDADGGFGDGDLTDLDTDTTLDPADDVTGDLGDDGLGDAGIDGVDLPSQDASPIEGVGYLIDQVREALFGPDDAAASVLDADLLAPGLGTESADLATETDLDLTGDGVVDHGDLLEAEQPFDFDPGGA